MADTTPRTDTFDGITGVPFREAMALEIEADLPNRFGAENWEESAWGPYPGPGPVWDPTVEEQLTRLDLDALGQTYDLLADDYSRRILVKVLAFRLFGPERVWLPRNTPEHWTQLEQLKALETGTDSVEVNHPGKGTMTMRRMDFRPIGMPFQLYYNPLGAQIILLDEQYAYKRPGVSVRAEPGDYAIDGGGAWGDTALYLANAVGAEGRVFSFEFEPRNIEVHERNVALNPALEGSIEIVPHALWDRSDEVLTYRENGAATRLMPDEAPATAALQTTTLSIDDLVARRSLPRLDFIKMDIEGAELEALKGAEQTLRRLKPKLAISAYHKEEDFVELPRYLHGLGLGYRFYLDCFSIFGQETMLFATAR
jgi:FkbM family methyltransferase